jgi:hypothetical protein
VQLRDLVLRINAMLSRTFLLDKFVSTEAEWMAAFQVLAHPSVAAGAASAARHAGNGCGANTV